MRKQIRIKLKTHTNLQINNHHKSTQTKLQMCAFHTNYKMYRKKSYNPYVYD